MAAKSIFQVSAVYNDPKDNTKDVIVLEPETILAASKDLAEKLAIRKIADEWTDKLEYIKVTAADITNLR